VVNEVRSRRVGRGGVENGDITVEFFTGTETQRAVIAVGSDVVHYSVGQAVTVRYQPTRPTNASVVGSSGQSSSWMVMTFFGVIIVAITGWAGRHVRRMRDVLQRHPWQARPAHMAEIPFRAGFRVRAQIAVVLWDPADEHEAIVVPLGVRRLSPAFQPVTWLCGDLDDALVVIAPPGGKPPLLARPVSTPANNDRLSEGTRRAQ